MSKHPEWRIDDPRRLGEYDAVVDPTQAAQIKQLEVNGAAVVEQSHEYVLKKKPEPDA